MSDNTIKPYKNKGECVPAAGNDLEGISNIIVESFKRSCGRPAVFENSAEGLEQFRQKTLEFFEYVAAVNEENGLERAVIPDIELWAAFLSVTRMTINTYERTRSAEWRDTISVVKNAIASYKKQMALNYKIPPMVFAFDFTNNHNYVNTTEFKIEATRTEPKEVIEKMAIEDQLAENNLQWNEETGEFEPRKGV